MSLGDIIKNLPPCGGLARHDQRPFKETVELNGITRVGAFTLYRSGGGARLAPAMNRWQGCGVFMFEAWRGGAELSRA